MSSQKTIDAILKERKGNESVGSDLADKFYSVISGEGIHENFLEIRFRDGLRTCFAYGDLTWFNYDPDSGILDAEFGGFLVSLKGRGLGDKLFHHLKSKRIAWVKEADSDFQDSDAIETWISEITITPPDGFGSEEEVS